MIFAEIKRENFGDRVFRVYLNKDIIIKVKVEAITNDVIFDEAAKNWLHSLGGGSSFKKAHRELVAGARQAYNKALIRRKNEI